VSSGRHTFCFVSQIAMHPLLAVADTFLYSAAAGALLALVAEMCCRWWQRRRDTDKVLYILTAPPRSCPPPHAAAAGRSPTLAGNNCAIKVTASFG
jgi:hypothetical protein